MRLFSSLIEPIEHMDEQQHDDKKSSVMMCNTVRLSIQPVPVKVFSLEANCFVDFEGGGRYRTQQHPASTRQPLPTDGEVQRGIEAGLTYTEGVRVSADGPYRHSRFKSYAKYGSERHFKETVFFESRLVPQTYVTAVIVSEEGGLIHPRLQYFEQVFFKNKTVIIRRAETVYNFPREPQRRHAAKTTFHQNRKERNFVSGILITAPGNVLLLELPPDVTATTNGDHRDNANGYGGDHAEADSKTVYSSVKEMAIY